MVEDSHDALCESLASTLRGNLARAPYFVAREVNLGSAWLEHGVPRADVLSVRPSYTRFCVSIYECKLSRNDFLADVNAGKWARYLPFCHRLYFAAPAGVIARADVPDGCGLMSHGEKGWATVRQARPRVDVSFDVNTLIGILVTCGNREINQRREPYRVTERGFWDRDNRELRRRVGAENALRIARLEELEREAESAAQHHADALNDLGSVLGMNVTGLQPGLIADKIREQVKGNLNAVDADELTRIGRWLLRLGGRA